MSIESSLSNVLVILPNIFFSLSVYGKFVPEIYRFKQLWYGKLNILRWSYFLDVCYRLTNKTNNLVYPVFIINTGLKIPPKPTLLVACTVQT